MSDLNAAPDGAGAPAPAPVAPAAESAPTPSDIGRMLASLRHQAAKEAQESATPATEPEPIPAQAENAAPPTEAPGEAPEAIEPATEPPIEPPRSWTKEAKEQWQTLPRHTQEYLAQREQERDREVRRSQNEAAEQRKAIEAQREAAEKARQQYEAALPALMQSLQDAQGGAFHDIKTVDDVRKLAAEDPFRYLQWDAHQKQLAAVQMEAQKAQERQHQEKQTNWNQHVQKETQLFDDSLSDADKAKLSEFRNEAPAFLQAKGFTQEDLAKLASGEDRLSIFDRRVQSLILDGMKFQAAQKAKATVTAKPVPPVQKPGVARPTGQANAEQLQALSAKLERSGKTQDLAAIIGAMRSGA